MMKEVFFILGIHNHQPVGNFDFVLADAFKKAYWPFLEILDRHPSIKICLHYSGILWEWLEHTHPLMIDLCKKLLDRGQIELLSGGFYEPILSIIPDHDKLGQMQKMGLFLKERFGVAPQGIWLAERVWEPGLPRFIYDAGLQYVIVDDLHFLVTGIDEENLHGYYITEDQGRMVRVFPGSKMLRYLIPFHQPGDTIEYLAKIRDMGNGDLAMMADDGEKFGVWPGTYKWVYQQEWLEQFFTLLEKNSSWIRMSTYSEYIAQHYPLGQVYLPTASYSEMEEWALPLDAQEGFHVLQDKLNQNGFDHRAHNFVRGGVWRNFLCKYREGNIIYNRMLLVSQKIQDIEKILPDGGEEWLREAKNEIWQGQCNDAYWHGLFGGLYLPHLRAALYAHLIQADNLVEAHRHTKPSWLECQIRDVNQDASDEIVINTDKHCLFIDPGAGGAIYEWDFRPKCFNIINSLIRRPESYHKKILAMASPQCKGSDGEGIKSIHDLQETKVEGLEKMLIYDRYSRSCLLDHFLSASATLETFSDLRYEEIGDFIQAPYGFEVIKDIEMLQICLSRIGRVGATGKLKITKTLTFYPGNSLVKIVYVLENKGKDTLTALFGIELNFNLLAGRSEDRFFLIDGELPKAPYLASKGSNMAIESISLKDTSLGLEISITTPKKAGLWRFPIETASNSEGGFEKVYQSSALLFHWPLSLKGGEIETYELDVTPREESPSAIQ